MRQAAREGVVSEVQGMRQMIDARQHGRAEEFAVIDHAAHRHAAKAHSVIALLAADQAGALARAAGPMVGNRDLQSRVDGLGARIGEEHAIHPRRCDRRQPIRQFERDRMAHLEGRGEFHGVELARHGVGDFAPAVAGIDAPQARHRVDHLPAVGGPVVHTLGARQQSRVGLELTIGRERHPKGVELAVGGGGSRGDSCVHGGPWAWGLQMISKFNTFLNFSDILAASV